VYVLATHRHLHTAKTIHVHLKSKMQLTYEASALYVRALLFMHRAIGQKTVVKKLPSASEPVWYNRPVDKPSHTKHVVSREPSSGSGAVKYQAAILYDVMNLPSARTKWSAHT
jgi:hypothetical protein